MTMGDMQDSNSKSLEKVLAQQRKKEIAADDYHSKIENWLRLADQMLGLQATGHRQQATAEKSLGHESATADRSTRSNANQKRSR